MAQRDKDLLNFDCANARSVVDKIGSVITAFEENALQFMLLTETWLTRKHCSPRALNDLTIGANLSFIRRDRGSRGGGVAICYDPTKIKMHMYSPANNVSTKGELVCAIGTTTLTKRKIVTISVYLPPAMKVGEVEETLENIISTVDQIKVKYSDPILIVEGDFNNQ